MPIGRLAIFVNGLRSVLGEVEDRSQVLLEKGKAARFVDKGRDSGEVVKLVERLRDAITRYQVSEDRFVGSNTTYTSGQVSQQQAIYGQQQVIYDQQQTIYDQITNLTVRTLRLVSILCTDD